MEREVLVKVEGVSKKFSKDLKRSLRYGLADIVRGVFKNDMKEELRKDEFWAVQDVSFEVRRGECLGLIGHNGAGKSTLLKMLNGLISPDKGRIEMRGRVGALIELGAGFNPVLTGRENIYNNGAVLGFSRAEIDTKMAEIIAFSEIEEYLDMPVQNYSSGMKVRLGFAVAAQMEPDILLIDEVLAVGDMGFVLKCYNKIDQLLQNTAIIFVSHGMPQVARMSTQILLLERGESFCYTQDIPKGIDAYYQRFKLEIGDYKGSDTAELVEVSLSQDKKKWWKQSDEITFDYLAPLHIKICIENSESIENPWFYLAFYDKEQRNFAEVYNFDKETVQLLEKGKHTFTATIPQLLFTQGKYSLTIGLSKNPINGSVETLFRAQSCIYFNVIGKTHGWAPVQLEAKWKNQII